MKGLYKNIKELESAFNKDILEHLKLISDSKKEILKEYVSNYLRVDDYIEVNYRSKISYFIVSEIRIELDNYMGVFTIDSNIIGRMVLKNIKLSDKIYRLSFDDVLRKVSRSELEHKRGHERKTKNYKDKYLYIFKNKIGSIKIGQAIDVEDRRRVIEMQSGIKTECLHSIKGAANYESLLHELYGEYRGIGEWFDLPHEEMLWLSHADLDQLEDRLNN